MDKQRERKVKIKERNSKLGKKWMKNLQELVNYERELKHKER